jgi:hypothetical protein
MRKARFAEQQLIEILKLAEAGIKVVDLCRKARHQSVDVLAVAQQVWRDGALPMPAPISVALRLMRRFMASAGRDSHGGAAGTAAARVSSFRPHPRPARTG